MGILAVDGDIVAPVGDAVGHSDVGVDLVPHLVEIRDVEASPGRYASGVGFLAAQQDLEQGTLAGPVCAEQANAVAALDDQLQVIDDALVAEGFRDMP